MEEEVYACLLLCQRIGYGHAMEIISALWRYDFKQRGIPTEGCFVPAIRNCINEGNRKINDITCKKYDELIKKVLCESD